MRLTSSLTLLLAGLAVSAGAFLGCVGDEPALPIADGGEDSTVSNGAAPAASLHDSGSTKGPGDATINNVGAGDVAPGSMDDRANAPEPDGPSGDDGASPCVSGGPCSPAQCGTGVTTCTDAGEAQCSPTGTSFNGSPCDGGVCYNGGCAPCSPGVDCTEAGSCQQATISCSTGEPVCTLQGNAANGTACGANLYCNDGGCAPCTNGASCSPASSPCHAGTVTCADGGIVCADTGNAAADGTPCGTNQVCASGQCVACTGGASCSPTSEPCKTGTTSCATGSSTCTGLSNVPDGTPCGTNMVCSGGGCAACSTGSSCQPNNNACLTGVVSCTTGSPVCTRTGQLSDGTSCGTNQVCSGGQCGTCTAGSTCNPGGNVCQVGMTSCATGSTTCTNVSNVTDGTSCGTNQVCYGGMCMACTSGTPCTPGNPPNACQTGKTSCTTGQQTCMVTGNAGNGTTCGTNQVCYGGMCMGCTSGTSCTPGTPPNPCQTGMTSCTTGLQTCPSNGNMNNGTACDAGYVCYQGTCSACTSGTSCTPGSPPNPCQTGMTSCTTGQQTCMANGNVMDGTSCGSGALCCSGSCATCSTTAHATLSCSGTTCVVSCTSGYGLCGSSCVDTTSDNSACGASCEVCPSGSTCTNSICLAKYGYPTAFSPCNTSNSVQNFGTGLLIVEKVTISASLTVTDLGVIGNQGGAHGTLVLYADSGGAPAALEAQTASTSIAAGDNQIAVTNVVTIPAGTYWVGGEYDGTSSLCVDSSQSNLLDYVMISSYGTVPNPFGTAHGSASVDVNYYVVGRE